MKRIVLALMTSVFALTFSGSAQDEISKLPWSLRDFYNFDSTNLRLIYAVDNGEWCLERISDGKVLLDKARAAVRLGDGTVIDANAMGPGDAFRRRDVTELGNGSRYGLILSGSQGVSVEHSITSHKEHPYYLIRMSVTNTSGAPIEIASISPVVIPRGAMAPLDPEVEVQRRTTTICGPSVTYDPAAPVSVISFHNKAAGYISALGVFPHDIAKTNIDLQFFDGQWQGEVRSEFNPPIKLAPGQSLECDPIWLAFTIDTPERHDQFVSYTHASQEKVTFDTDEVEAWSTAGDGEPLAAVEAAARAWAGAGVKYTLIPYGWEGRPGSREGASPAYPKNMSGAASQLRAAGVTPGITVDPLDVGKGEAPWALSSEDGHIWANPADPAGREAVLKAMRDVAGWGFGFYVVRPSNIPDAALQQFGLTRNQADVLAYTIMIEAAGETPVYVAPTATLGANLDQWLQAAACSTRLDEYDSVAGPVRFNGSQSVGADVLMAMVLFGGPIEFVGDPGRDLQNGLQQVLPKPRIWSRAVDACAEAPRLWELHMLMNEQQPTETALLAFNGAPAGSGGEVWAADEATLKKLAAKFMSLRGVTKRPVRAAQ